MKTLKEQLLLLNKHTEKYQKFVYKLLPGIEESHILGIPIPVLRSFANDLIKNEKRESLFEFICALPHYYLEENLIHAFLISKLTKDIDEIFSLLDRFLPFVDNWEVCDTFGLKIFKKYPNEVRMKMYEYLQSDHPFTVRFAIVTMINYLLKDNFCKQDLIALQEVKSDNYYVKMALAWYYSFALIHNYNDVIGLIETKKLDPFVHRMTIQKAIDSYRITDEQKNYLRSKR